VLEMQWVACPICNSKTRIKIRRDTIMENFPLFCPKCKQEKIINVQNLQVTIIKEPDAQTQSR
jgi:Zn finger protein HypA/HybF involved in hydrogenase expression